MNIARLLLAWIGAKFRLVATSEDHNAYYAWADTRLDELAAAADQARKQKEREALERHLNRRRSQ